MRTSLRLACLVPAATTVVVAVFAACGSSNNGVGGEGDAGVLADAGAPDAEVPIAWTSGTTGVSLVQGSRTLVTLKRVTAMSIVPNIASSLAGLFDPITRTVSSSSDLTPKLLGGGVELDTSAGTKVGTITLSLAGATATLHAKVDASASGGAAGDTTALSFVFAKPAAARFAGFGEQFARVDWSGYTVPIWVRDKNEGRSATPIPSVTGGTETDTWFPMPYFVDSVNGYGFLLTNTEFSQFDLGVADPSSWSVEVWNGTQVEMNVFAGPTTPDVVTELGAIVGKPQTRPPDWAFSGVWLAAQTGTSYVLSRAQKAISDGVPLTAVWAQDWLGGRKTIRGGYGVQYHWSVDDTLYPNLSQTIATLNQEGVRFLGYFNPFVVQELELFTDATTDGYLPSPSDQNIGVLYHGTVFDVSSPAAVSWYQGYAATALGLGMSGWMADFGEALQNDAIAQGGSGATLHNEYPVGWAKANRDALAKAHPDGDYVLFSRSGFTGAQGAMQILWAGDQGIAWDTDGLRVVVRAGLSSGLGGVLFFTHDIAGFYGGPATPELYRRWTELGAFTPIMRTHDGEMRYPEDQYDADPVTQALFVRAAQIHAALAPYWIQTADDAMTSGLPMVRHLSLVDPTWQGAWAVDDEWALGNDLIFAPVVDQGATTASVTLPDGNWEHLLTGATATGRQTLTVDAPVGLPAVFVRSGTMTDVVTKIRAIYAAEPVDASAPPGDDGGDDAASPVDAGGLDGGGDAAADGP